MTRNAVKTVGKAAQRRSPQASIARSCALLGTFGGGAAIVAAMLASPASRHTASTTRPAAISREASLAAAKQGRVHTPAVATQTPLPAHRPATVQAAAKSGRLMTLLAAIPRPALPTSPMLMSRMAALDVEAGTQFVPPVQVAVPLAGLVQVAALAADEPVLLASLSPANEQPPQPPVAEEHVETQLPELKPQSAVAALTQAIEDAVIPLPAARPERVVPIPPRRRGLPTANVLAYARPDAGIEEAPEVEETAPMQGLSRGVAIYDISAATVYLPNGEKLEAHSGLGKMRDDPRQVHQKNRGPTPPHTYDLTMRESLFHGVQAIRLNPIGGEGRIHNRNGLLAHTYMLGKGGDSNGCVSFKDYKRFLAAFKRGDVKRLVVVPSMSRSSRLARPKSLIASLFGSKA